jgi:ferrous iron transport protein B
MNKSSHVHISKHLFMEVHMAQNSVCTCHTDGTNEDVGLKKVVMIGNPNVGKSALFNRLTGTYVVVSNYPGTTVAVSRGKCKIGDEEFTVEDTPGMYSLLPITGEERVTRDILLSRKADIAGTIFVKRG